jgi:catechol 2,3-dioxygenase-like lactoylglutathione lyase family enzyme
MIRLDHVLHGVKDLATATRDFRERLGMNAVVGGVHPGRGTHNSLVHLGNVYIELISVSDPIPGRAETLQAFLADGDGPFDFAFATSDIAKASTDLRARGVTVGETRDGSRRTPEGSMLSWKAATTSAGPFMIEWGDHPEWFASRVELAKHEVPWGNVHALLVAAAEPRRLAEEYARQLGWESQGTPTDDLVTLGMPGADGVNASLGPAPLVALLRPAGRPGAVLDAALRAKLDRSGDGFVGLAVHTPDLDAAVAELGRRGTRVERHVSWAIVDPADAHGLLLELVG